MATRTLKEYQGHKAYKECKSEIENKGFNFSQHSEEEVLERVSSWFNEKGKRFSKPRKSNTEIINTNNNDIDKIIFELVDRTDISAERIVELQRKAKSLSKRKKEIEKKIAAKTQLENEIKELQEKYEADKIEILEAK